MSSLARGVHNAFRKPARLLAVVGLVGLALGLALTMAAARSAVDSRVATVRSTVGTQLTVQSAQAGGFGGGFGGGGGGAGAGFGSLAQDNLTFIATLPHVASQRLDLVAFTAAANTSLTPVAGGFGPGGGRGGGGGGDGGGRGGRGGFGGGSPPIPTIGTTDFTVVPLGGGTAPLTLVSGTTPDNQAQPAALVGQALAENNSLVAGSTFQLYGKTVTVSGIFSGNGFAGRALVLPLATFQELAQRPGEVTSATVHVDSIDNLGAVQTAIQSQLGADVDVVSSEQDATAATASLADIGRVAATSLWVCAAAAAAIVVLVMVLVARERRREIGTLKAIGAPTSRIVAQFAAESLAFTLLALVVAVMLAYALRGPVASWLGTQGSTAGGRGAGAGGGFFVGPAGGFGAQALGSLNASPGLLLAGAGLAVLLGVLGSVGPALTVAWTRPATVLRGA